MDGGSCWTTPMLHRGSSSRSSGGGGGGGSLGGVASHVRVQLLQLLKVLREVSWLVQPSALPLAAMLLTTVVVRLPLRLHLP